MGLLEDLRKQRLLARRRKAATRGFDLHPLPRAGLLAVCSIAILAMLVQIILEIGDGVLPFGIQHVADAASLIVMAGLGCSMLYFGFFIFARLQFSLLEFCLLSGGIVVLEGQLFTIPGIMETPRIAGVIALALPVVMLHATYEALIEIRLLGIERPLPRLLVLIADFAATLGIWMSFAGVLLWLGPHTGMVTPGMASRGGVLAIIGVLCLIPGFVIGRKATRAAKKILMEEEFLKSLDEADKSG